MTETMKNLGIVAIVVGIVVLVLAAGFILYSRGRRRISA